MWFVIARWLKQLICSIKFFIESIEMVSPLFLCNCATTLTVPPLRRLLKLFLSSGIFLAKWNNIIPFFQSGSRSNVEKRHCIAKDWKIFRLFEFPHGFFKLCHRYFGIRRLDWCYIDIHYLSQIGCTFRLDFIIFKYKIYSYIQSFN